MQRNIIVDFFNRYSVSDTVLCNRNINTIINVDKPTPYIPEVQYANKIIHSCKKHPKIRQNTTLITEIVQNINVNVENSFTAILKRPLVSLPEQKTFWTKRINTYRHEMHVINAQHKIDKPKRLQ